MLRGSENFRPYRRKVTVTGMARKYLLTTLGCKVNQYESQRIRELFNSLGLEPAGASDVPDITVVNTCAVTGNASRKSRQALRRLTRSGASTVVAVGCAASDDPQRLRDLPGVAAVFGHDVDICAELDKLLRKTEQPSSSQSTPIPAATPEPSKRRQAKRNEVWMNPVALDASSVMTSRLQKLTRSAKTIVSRPLPVVNSDEVLSTGIESFAGHQRAFLKVQDGCDAWCSYCIIPRLRPKLRSKPINVAVAEAESLVAAGHKEIIVTGIFLGAYGRETAVRKRFGRGRSPLAGLVEALADVKGLARLRLSSLEPGDVDADLLTVLASGDVCVPHLHLPLQAGSSGVLRRMNRQYTAEEFVEMVDQVRCALDRPAISTDIMVGFPGETEREFEETLAMARFTGFMKIHAFPFSPRPRTAAARRQEEFIGPATLRDRMAALSQLEQRMSVEFRRQFVGRLERVLVESEQANSGSSDHTAAIKGRSDRYFEVRLNDRSASPGDLVTVRIDRVTPSRTHGSIMDPNTGAIPLPVLREVAECS